jgi:23S rRNA (guanine2445-N2)-methyltransferase / 23S rRNA (guanine2069-N7)-methyltransferase
MEHLLATELSSLGANDIKQTVAGVHFSGDLAVAYRVCLWSRLANRVLVQLAQYKVNSQDDLYQGVQSIDWTAHLSPQGSFAVTFNVKNSQAINNSHFGALKVKDAVVDQMRAKFNKRPDIDTERPNIRINVMLNAETATISLDLSGESLHRRGYRDINIKAPIKENLAAALLIRSGWPKIAQAGGSLIDPMCGSGTLLIEAAMIAADYAPGLLRDYYGFLGWKQHDNQQWQSLLTEADARKSTGITKMPVIAGFDHDRRNLSAARNHIETAGLDQHILLECREISDAAPVKNWPVGLVICNPPYGERLGDEQETALLYKKFGETLKGNFHHWQAAMIVSDAELGFRMGIRSQKPATFYNGTLECKLLRMSIEEKAFFDPKPLTKDERISHIHKLIDNPYRNAPTIKLTALSEPDKLGADPEQTDQAKMAGLPQLFVPGAESFVNRLKKNLKNLANWKNKNRIDCYRIYDADLPEYAAAIDLYHDQDGQSWVNVQEYEPPLNIDPAKANQRLTWLMAELPNALALPKDHLFLKIRRKQKQLDQYEKLGDQGRFHTIEEHGCKLLVNFTDYLDTGLFLDHRPIRWLIQQQAKDKRFLNLFAYTGSATVHAAVGGAKATTTVDMSRTYLDWAKKNLALNPTAGEHEFIQADCLEWLEKEADHPYPRQYDLIFLDPPTFSNSKRMEENFDIQTDHVTLINRALRLLSKTGILYFSTNFRRFKLEQQALSSFKVENISAQTIPPDFTRNPRIHYCWKISK